MWKHIENWGLNIEKDRTVANNKSCTHITQTMPVISLKPCHFPTLKMNASRITQTVPLQSVK